MRYAASGRHAAALPRRSDGLTRASESGHVGV